MSTLALGLGLGLRSNVIARALDESDESDRILVVLELSGGNDGLNMVVPYGDDAYYRLRPTIGISENNVLKLDGHFGFNPGLRGLHRLWKENKDMRINKEVKIEIQTIQGTELQKSLRYGAD